MWVDGYASSSPIQTTQTIVLKNTSAYNMILNTVEIRIFKRNAYLARSRHREIDELTEVLVVEVAVGSIEHASRSTVREADHGVTYAPKPAQHVVAANIPLGLGLKYKVVSRLNVGCELSFRFTTTDKLDVTDRTAPVLDDPYGIKSGALKNKDSYSFLSIFVTYDLSPKYRKCNN